ncbi:TorD/DmsD family molecular chaperone [Yersinia aleksiciae]|uniref:TorD/DmsD family molecular chaperone n=1 Tax=Yersinia aleksiciae TaxID=263819 RepID=UPI0011A91590|nr:molecular chaperone [Yersinia aleksiciae]MDA5497210.1 molecular chaperone [Yersinia aleksiciae]NIK97852.1 molecular chaperone [Yersinia aleksiciae]WQC71814.1 molecular chaperone [Yersinia aleksiciae]
MTLITTTLPRILGALFYYPPQSATVQRLWPLLPQIAEIFPWPNSAKIAQYCQQIPAITPEKLEYDFSILFEGQGEMPAPPWGSVYLDKENMLMGASTLQYREFLSRLGLTSQSAIREPEDQFGLMLLAWVHLVEQDSTQQQPGEAAMALLTEHLLPWAYRYLELVQNAQTEYQVYPMLAKIGECYLKTLQTELGLHPQLHELYR